MPGVLIDDMPFLLDSVSTSVSPSASPTFYRYQQPPSPTYDQQQLLDLLAAVQNSSPPQQHLDSASAASLLHRFLPSNNSDESSWSAEDVYSCDEFRMFEFKVRRCMRGRSHDWTECPFAHPGEKARRRDPRRFHYSGTACPDFRKGSCKNGDACELAHGVFECWLHPARYRTQQCKDGRACKRRVCFFAHTAEQLRLLSSSSPSASASSSSSSSAAASDLGHSPCSSPRRGGSGECWCSGLQPQYRAVCCGGGRAVSSPTSTLVGVAHSPPPLSPPLSPSQSPPMSPSGGVSRARHFDGRRMYSAPSSPSAAVHRSAVAPKTMSELVSALQQLELHKQHVVQQYSPSPLRPGGMPCGAPRGISVSVPVTPTKPRWETMWEMDMGEEEVSEEEMMMVAPRVESGRDLRAKIYGRLANRVDTFGSEMGNEPSPDLNWVNDLVTE